MQDTQERTEAYWREKANIDMRSPAELYLDNHGPIVDNPELQVEIDHILHYRSLGQYPDGSIIGSWRNWRNRHCEKNTPGSP